MAKYLMTMTKTTVHWAAAVGWRTLHFIAMHFYSNTYQVTTRVKHLS